MNKLFASNYGHRPQFQFTKHRFCIPISHIHNHTETLLSHPPTEDVTIQISHPWPEWVKLMQHLLRGGYFEGIGIPFGNRQMGGKESNQIRTASLNFARDRFHIMRYFSRKDIQAIAGSGCPSIDRKVVNSGKRLRAYLGIDEGNVCSLCALRGNCERAYVKAREDEGGRTVDIMRFLITYGLDPITDFAGDKACPNNRAKESVRRLLKEMVEFSMKELCSDPPITTSSNLKSFIQERSTQQDDYDSDISKRLGDWMCPKCSFLNFARNIKCLSCDGLFQERLKKLGEYQDHLPLKKGDWICDKCNFLNFAKNTRCMQCKEYPPKRQLNPGEWECDSCNYINFRRNMVCLKCDHRRPKASVSATSFAQPVGDSESYRQSRPYFGQQRQIWDDGVDMWKFVEDESRDQNVSNSWNNVSGLVDFPVAGGKSNLSRSVLKQERWKIEMAERSSNTTNARVNADEFKSAIIRSSESLEYTDSEEMAEWFGKR